MGGDARMKERKSVIKVRYKSTNCYFVEAKDGLLAFDAGWPGTYRQYKDGLREQGWSVKDIRWLMVSHFHLDHAGLAGVLVGNGVEFVAFPEQIGAIEAMEALIARKGMDYQSLDRSRVHMLEIHESRAWLASIGILGEALRTDGHSPDSIALILDSGEAFVGDLTPENMVWEDDPRSKASWALLRAKGARRVCPAHAEEFVLSF